MKTSELTGAALDWAVWSIEFKDAHKTDDVDLLYEALQPYKPSTEWSQGGPIIERESIALTVGHIEAHWGAACGVYRGYGSTPLVAAMRCYVAAKLGDEVELPEGLQNN